MDLGFNLGFFRDNWKKLGEIDQKEKMGGNWGRAETVRDIRGN